MFLTRPGFLGKVMQPHYSVFFLLCFFSYLKSGKWMRHSPESPESSTALVISHKCGCLGKRFTVKISNKRQARIFCLHCVSQYKLTVKHTQTQEYKIIFKLHYQNLQIQIKMIVIVQKSAPECQETPCSPVAVVPNARRPAWVRDT